jgi:hypothetical protein
MADQKFGRLTVIKRAGSNKEGKALWLVKCDCGKTKTVTGKALRDPKRPTRSCGCLQKEIAAKIRTHDLTNQRFGRLVAIKPTNKRSSGKIIWFCKCDCGNHCEVSSNNLVSGGTKSCGCLLQEFFESQKIDMTGQTFHNLTALRIVGSDPATKCLLWEFECKCGNLTVNRGSAVRSGKVKGCGCYRTLQLKGQRFNRLIVVEKVGSLWKCKCDCGGETIAQAYDLINGKVQSCGCYNIEKLKERKGLKHPMWKGGITPLHTLIRNSAEYAQWKDNIFQRDDYKCQRCSKTKCYLNAHHIIPFSILLDFYRPKNLDEALKCKLFWAADNGVSLCEDCHNWIHSLGNDDGELLDTLQ